MTRPRTIDELAGNVATKNDRISIALVKARNAALGWTGKRRRTVDQTSGELRSTLEAQALYSTQYLIHDVQTKVQLPVESDVDIANAPL